MNLNLKTQSRNSYLTLDHVALFEKKPNAFYLIDTQYRLVSFNKSAQRHAHKVWSKELKVGDLITDLTPQPHGKVFVQNFQKCLRGESFTEETEIQLDNCQKVWLNARYYPVKNEQSEIVGVALSSSDITHHKQMERRLNQREFNLQAIFNHTEQAFLLIDQDYHILEFNKASQEYALNYWGQELLLGEYILGYLNTEYKEEFKSCFQDALFGETVRMEKIHTSIHGQQKYYEICYAPIHDQDNEVSAVVVSCTDITDRKFTEQKLKLSEDRLKELNEKLIDQNQALQQNQDNLMIANQKMADQQARLENLLDRFKELNEKLLEQNTDFAQQEEELALANQKLLEKQEELRMVNERLVDQNSSLEEHEDQLIRANNQLLHQHKELQEALAELSDRNLELDQIVYRTSHDIRSPLTSVLGLISLIKLEGVPDNLKDYLRQIEVSIQKLDRFVGDMLNFAKANRTNRPPEIIDFELLITNCFEQVKYLPNFDLVAKKVIISGDSQSFKNDFFRLDVIFSNIISNAIKYMNTNQEESFFLIDIQVYKSLALVKFKDNGIGISKTYLNRVFDMFFRATDKSEGSGLGLYIVKQTVEKLNGSIDIQSVYGHGTEITIGIPSMSDTPI